MQKLIAFDLYRRKESGAHDRLFPGTNAPHEVYLASEVDARIEADNAAQLKLCEEAQLYAARIAELKSHVATLTRSNERLRQKLDALK